MLPLLLWAVLQAATPQYAQPVNPLLADCSGERNSKGCRSFNELVKSNDKEIMRMISDDAYVCFRPDDDAFFLIAFHEPHNGFSEFPIVGYERFTNGVSDQFVIAYGRWGKAPDGSPQFSETKAPASKNLTIEGHAGISTDEPTYNYSFKNASGTTTEYNLTIRRSTLRFIENYRWPDAKEKTKEIKDFSGYCSSYESVK